MGLRLPDAFLSRPIAHRALHGPGRPENSMAAVQAAVAAGYGIEIDVQPSVDGAAMVFHDYDMARLTGRTGSVAQCSAADLAATPLLGGEGGVPTLGQVLAEVRGQVPVLIEVKDQDGVMGPNVGPLEAEVARALEGYAGPVAVMSFNPHSVAVLAEAAPEVPRGLTTCGYEAEAWPLVPAARRVDLAGIADLERLGACFISHDWRDLTRPRVTEVAAEGRDILCWTVRSEEDEAIARQVAGNVTFEGYLPA